jgi:hypothetical protein
MASKVSIEDDRIINELLEDRLSYFGRDDINIEKYNKPTTRLPSVYLLNNAKEGRYTKHNKEIVNKLIFHILIDDLRILYAHGIYIYRPIYIYTNNRNNCYIHAY